MEVRKLVDEVKTGGHHRLVWDGKDRLGNVVASGVYLYRVMFTAKESAEIFTRSGKMSALRRNKKHFFAKRSRLLNYIAKAITFGSFICPT